MKSLFSASSTFPRERKEELIYHWYRPDRSEPVLAYEQVIADYASLPPDVRLQAEPKSRELLTGEELEKLRVFLLKTKGLEVVSKEFPLPLDPQGLLKSMPKEIFEFWKEDSYTLPFRIQAYVQREPIPLDDEIDTGVLD